MNNRKYPAGIFKPENWTVKLDFGDLSHNDVEDINKNKNFIARFVYFTRVNNKSLNTMMLLALKAIYYIPAFIIHELSHIIFGYIFYFMDLKMHNWQFEFCKIKGSGLGSAMTIYGLTINVEYNEKSNISRICALIACAAPSIIWLFMFLASWYFIIFGHFSVAIIAMIVHLYLLSAAEAFNISRTDFKSISKILKELNWIETK